MATAKAKEQQLEANIKTLKDAGQSTEVLEDTLESLRLNTQKAEAHATELMAKVDSLDPNSKTEEPEAEESKVVDQPQPKQEASASTNAKAGVTNVRTKKGGRKGRK